MLQRANRDGKWFVKHTAAILLAAVFVSAMAGCDNRIQKELDGDGGETSVDMEVGPLGANSPLSLENQEIVATNLMGEKSVTAYKALPAEPPAELQCDYNTLLSWKQSPPALDYRQTYRQQTERAFVDAPTKQVYMMGEERTVTFANTKENGQWYVYLDDEGNKYTFEKDSDACFSYFFQGGSRNQETWFGDSDTAIRKLPIATFKRIEAAAAELIGRYIDLSVYTDNGCMYNPSSGETTVSYVKYKDGIMTFDQVGVSFGREGNINDIVFKNTGKFDDLEIPAFDIDEVTAAARAQAQSSLEYPITRFEVKYQRLTFDEEGALCVETSADYYFTDDGPDARERPRYNVYFYPLTADTKTTLETSGLQAAA